MKLLPLFLAAYLSLSSHTQNKPLEVLIIGGGPAGLAAAIEARLQGHFARVIEKRDVYSRQQWVFLDPSTLERMAKWGVNLSDMPPMDPQDCLVQIVPIQVLEHKLAKQALFLGVEIVQGTFITLDQDKKYTAQILMADGTQKLLPYDILIGADGAHSPVRKALQIESHTIDCAEGICALLPIHNAVFDLSEPLAVGPGQFLRRIQASQGTMVFMQRPSQASMEDLLEAVDKQGWTIEANALRESQAAFITDISVNLTQSTAFSSPSHSALLIGDATATASFLQGKGANTALKAAEIAGEFFKTRSFETFDQKMQAITDEMIQDSQFLYQ